MFYNEGKSVITGPVVLCWDGLSTPDRREDGSLNHNVRVLIHPQVPEFAELQQIASNVLNNRKNLPAGDWQQNWNWPLNTQADPAKYGPEYAGFMTIGGGSSKGPCTVVDANNNQLDPMHYTSMLQPGCIVRLILNAFDYKNKQTGIGFGLEGLMIVDPNAPRLPVAAGMSASQVANAFGGAGGGMANPPAGSPPGQQPPAMNPGMAPGPAAQPPGAQPPAGMQPPGMAPGQPPAAGGPGPGAPLSGPAGMPNGAPGMQPTTGPAPTPAAVPGQPPGMAPAPAAAPAAAPAKVMTAKAGGSTYDQFIAQGWTDEQMIAEGYMQA